MSAVPELERGAALRRENALVEPRLIQDRLPTPLVAAPKQLRVAIVGCGYWGINYVRILSELPDMRVVAVCDQRADRLAELGQRHSDLELTTSVTDAVAAPDVDAVVIATQAHTHYEIATTCLEAGKHVLVEKPLTTNGADADRLIRLAERNELTLMVGHTFLYNDAVRVVKRYVDADAVGRVYYLYARRTNLGPIRHDVNAIWDLAAHDVSIFNYLLEALPEWVSAVGGRVLRNGREDVGFVSLGYPDEVLAHLHVSWADPNKVREVVVVGSESRIVFNDVDPLERVRVFEKGVAEVRSMDEAGPTYGEHHLRLRDGDIISPRIDANEPLKVQCNHFMHCVRTGERPLTDGRVGANVVRVMEAIDTSLQRRGEPVAVAW